MLPVLTRRGDARGRPPHHRGGRTARGRAHGERGRGGGPRWSRSAIPTCAVPSSCAARATTAATASWSRGASWRRDPEVLLLASAGRGDRATPRSTSRPTRRAGDASRRSSTRRRSPASRERAGTPSLVIDAVFGTGLRDRPTGLSALAIAADGGLGRRGLARRGRGHPLGPARGLERLRRAERRGHD